VTLDDGSVLVTDSIDRLETQLGDAPPEVIIDAGELRIVSAWRDQGLLEDPLPDARVVHSDNGVHSDNTTLGLSPRRTSTPMVSSVILSRALPWNSWIKRPA
jgi:hypothetical protein